MNDYPENSTWSDWHCNTSNMMIEGIQHTLQNCERFIQLDIYSWKTTILDRYFFFVEPMIQEDRYYFWNSGSIERAIVLAKHYAETRCSRVYASKDDLFWVSCEDIEE